jgi:hypothetical protein
VKLNEGKQREKEIYVEREREEESCIYKINTTVEGLINGNLVLVFYKIFFVSVFYNSWEHGSIDFQRK